jgi:hypothetical protein
MGSAVKCKRFEPPAMVANLADLGGEETVPVHSKEKTSHRVAHIASKGLQMPQVPSSEAAHTGLQNRMISSSQAFGYGSRLALREHLKRHRILMLQLVRPNKSLDGNDFNDPARHAGSNAPEYPAPYLGRELLTF